MKVLFEYCDQREWVLPTLLHISSLGYPAFRGINGKTQVQIKHVASSFRRVTI